MGFAFSLRIPIQINRSFDAPKTRARYFLTKWDATFLQLGFYLPLRSKNRRGNGPSALRRAPWMGDGSVPRFPSSSYQIGEVDLGCFRGGCLPPTPLLQRAKIHHSGTILRFSWDCHPTHTHLRGMVFDMAHPGGWRRASFVPDSGNNSNLLGGEKDQ